MRHYTRRPLPGDPTDPESLRALLEHYLLWMATHHYAQGTVLVRRITLANFLRWSHERSVTQARDVTREMLQRYQRHLFFYRKRNGEPLSVSSQAHWLTALRSWFAWMARERLLEHDPASLLQLPREEHRLPRNALSQSEVEAVLAQPNLARPCGLRDRAILEMLYSTGLRREEALDLHLGDLDRARGTLLVRRGKGNKDRFVPIGPRALAWLDKYLSEVRPKFLVDPNTQTIFLARTGNKLRADQLSMTVRQYLVKAGIAKQGACHLFRHTAATLMLEGGADVRYIQALLGHASLATTEIYTHVTIAKLREVHEKTHPGRLYREPGKGPQALNPAGPGGNADKDDANPKDGDADRGNPDRGPAAGDDPDDDLDGSACLA